MTDGDPSDDKISRSEFFAGKEPDNPFRSPSLAQSAGGEPPVGVDWTLYQSHGAVRQVRPIAICMIVQGVLICLMGGGVTTLACFMLNIPADELGDDAIIFSEMQGPIIWIWGILAGVVLSIGLLTIVAGARNLSFRGRTMGIVALSLGILTSFTCYCAPTAIALAIWGLIVYLNPSVARAFELANDGTKPRDILAMVRKPGT